MRKDATGWSLWYVAGGLGLFGAGVVWDSVWHSRHEDSGVSGGAELIEAHWLMFLGMLVVLATSFAAAARAAPGQAAPARVAFVGSVLAVIGFGWDSVRHAQGDESVPAHLLIYAGLAVVVASLLWAVAATRRERRTSSAAR